jgi:uncharacterized protein DUF3455
MRPHIAERLRVLACAALFASAAATSGNEDATVAATLKPPAGEVLKLKLVGNGVQIYQCQQGAWKFQAPDAKLSDETGHVVGKHYAGPTWESADGSKIVGEVKAHEDSPDSRAIPWLLLGVKSASGNGVFGNIRSIQRLQTSGGQAPHRSCDASHANQSARVPYSAHYYFYTAP